LEIPTKEDEGEVKVKVVAAPPQEDIAPVMVGVVGTPEQTEPTVAHAKYWSFVKGPPEAVVLLDIVYKVFGAIAPVPVVNDFSTQVPFKAGA
jgi:hypothetical protein